MKIFGRHVKMKGVAIKLHPTEEWTTKGSKHEHLPPTPLRGIVLGPTNSGKSCVLVSMILDMYRNAWERIYIFSPSVHLDSCWKPVKDYIENDLKVDGDKEPFFFDKWEPEVLNDIVDTQRRVIEESKKQKIKQLYGILIIIDDWADSPNVVHSNSGAASGGSMLNTLFIRGRHMMISTIVSSQRLRLLAPTMRVNVQFMLVWRLRNRLELQSLLEEISAVYDIKTLEKMYQMATDDPYSFWYILFTARKKEDMFFLRFEQKMIPVKDGSLSRPDTNSDLQPTRTPTSGSSITK
jgi:hypothetical protein